MHDSEALSSIEAWSLGELLAAFGAEYSHHTSTDYVVCATETNREIVNQAIEFGNAELHDEDRISLAPPITLGESVLDIYDDWLMLYFAHRCKLASNAQSGPDALRGAELRLMADMLLYILRSQDDDRVDEDEEEFGLEATPESRAFISNVIRYGRRPGWDSALAAVESEGRVVSAYRTDLLKWFAFRCQKIAEDRND